MAAEGAVRTFGEPAWAGVKLTDTDRARAVLERLVEAGHDRRHSTFSDQTLAALAGVAGAVETLLPGHGKNHRHRKALHRLAEQAVTGDDPGRALLRDGIAAVWDRAPAVEYATPRPKGGRGRSDSSPIPASTFGFTESTYDIVKSTYDSSNPML